MAEDFKRSSDTQSFGANDSDLDEPKAVCSPNNGCDKSGIETALSRLLDAQERLLEGMMRESAARLTMATESVQTISALETEVAQLTDALHAAERGKLVAEQRLKRELMNPQSRTGLDRVLISAVGMAFGVEIIEPSRRHRIASQLCTRGYELFGFSLDQKTARKYVNEAVEAYLTATGS